MTKTNELREKIAEAATRCFERFGPQRTSMNDIADAAGMSRPTVYRVFEDRQSLTYYILNQRMDLIAKRVQDSLKKYNTLEEALVEGSIVSVRFGREDELFNNIVLHSLNNDMELFFLKSGSEIHRKLVAIWGPWIQNGRALGSVPPELSDDQIVEWIRYVQNSLMLRSDQDEEAYRELLRNFLVPSIVRSPRDRA